MTTFMSLVDFLISNLAESPIRNLSCPSTVHDIPLYKSGNSMTIILSPFNTIDLADINTNASLLNLVGDGNVAIPAIAGDTGIEVITGATDLSSADDSDWILIADITTAISSTSALEDALEYGGALQIKVRGPWAVGDRTIVVYDDNVSTYIAMVTTNTAVPNDTYFGAGTLTAVQLVKLTGLTEASVAIVAGDVDLITGS